MEKGNCEPPKSCVCGVKLTGNVGVNCSYIEYRGWGEHCTAVQSWLEDKPGENQKLSVFLGA